jgi:hypothetical protein
MNSRRFTAECFPCFGLKVSTPRWCRNLLRCGISSRLMSALGLGCVKTFQLPIICSPGSVANIPRIASLHHFAVEARRGPSEGLAARGANLQEISKEIQAWLQDCHRELCGILGDEDRLHR